MSIEEAPGFDPIDILYQDDDLLVADKPPALLVHRSRESSDRVFLLQLLRDQVERYLYPVQRLDRAASGAIGGNFFPREYFLKRASSFGKITHLIKANY